MTYRYRLSCEADLADIILLDQVANPHPWGKSLIEQNLQPQQKRLNWLVFDQNQDLCGWLTASHILDESELELILVSPHVRRQGLAQGLIQAWLKQIKLIPVNLCMLEVRESNLAARHLYEKLGFIEVGRRKNYYPTELGKEAAILMNLTLSKD
jgi:ribosomal-protein-alanine N-acetyltransferase